MFVHAVTPKMITQRKRYKKKKYIYIKGPELPVEIPLDVQFKSSKVTQHWPRYLGMPYRERLPSDPRGAGGWKPSSDLQQDLVAERAEVSVYTVKHIQSYTLKVSGSKPPDVCQC